MFLDFVVDWMALSYSKLAAPSIRLVFPNDRDLLNGRLWTMQATNTWVAPFPRIQTSRIHTNPMKGVNRLNVVNVVTFSCILVWIGDGWLLGREAWSIFCHWSLPTPFVSFSFRNLAIVAFTLSSANVINRLLECNQMPPSPVPFSNPDSPGKPQDENKHVGKGNVTSKLLFCNNPTSN